MRSITIALFLLAVAICCSVAASTARAGDCPDIDLGNGTTVFLASLDASNFAVGATSLTNFVQHFEGGTSNYPWAFSPCGKFGTGTTPSTYSDGAYAGQAASSASPLTDIGKDLAFKTMTTAPHANGGSIQAVYSGVNNWGNPWTLTLNIFCYGSSDSLVVAKDYDVTSSSGSAFSATFNAYSKKFCAIVTGPTPPPTPAPPPPPAPTAAPAGSCFDVQLTNGSAVHLSELGTAFTFGDSGSAISFKQLGVGGGSYPWAFSPCAPFSAATSPSSLCVGAFAGQGAGASLSQMCSTISLTKMTQVPAQDGDHLAAKYSGTSTQNGMEWDMTINMFCDATGNPNLQIDLFYNAEVNGNTVAVTFAARSKSFCATSSCYALTSTQCTMPENLKHCRYCNTSGICVPKTTTSCACTDLPLQYCNDATECGMLAPVLSIPDAPSYCGPKSFVNCPLKTCTAFGRDLALCKAAGCDATSSICKPGSCFQFFLPGAVPMPVMLVICGILKDILVILVVGAARARILRGIRQCVARVKHALCSAPPVDFGKTVYIHDEICRDKCNFSFATYVNLVADALFEIDGSLLGSAGENEEEEEEEEEETAERWRHRLLDAVAFQCVSSNVWIHLPSIIGAGGGGGGASASPEQDDDDSNAVRSAASSPNTSTAAAAVRVGSSSSIITKKMLHKRDFNSHATISFSVAQQIEATPRFIVTYKMSRSSTTNAALAINSFPGDLQLMYFLCGLGLVFSSVIIDVIRNYELVAKVAETACNVNTSSNTNNSSSSPHAVTLSDFTGTVGTAAWYLLGYHIVQSSFLSTAMLVTVKTVRALWHLRADDYDSLPMAERLPLLSFYSKRSVQFLLLFYFALVLPFCFTGIYGAFVHWPAAVPLGIGVVALAIVALALSCYQRWCGGGGKRTTSSSSSSSRKGSAGRFWRRANTSSQLELEPADEGALQRASTVTTAFRVRPASSSASASPKSGDDDDNNNNKLLLASPKQHGKYGTTDDDDGEQTMLESSSATTVVDGSSTNNKKSLPLAIGEFLLKEELAVIILTLMFQLSFAYSAMLSYAAEFDLATTPSDVFGLDFDSRSLECVFERRSQSYSRVITTASSFLPFL